MTFDIDKYPLEKLDKVSKILTSVGFLREIKAETETKEKTFILSPSAYMPGNTEFSMVYANGFQKGYAVFPKECVNIVYLTSVLNTTVSWAWITNGNLNQKTTITKKNLSQITIRILPAKIQKAIAYLYYLQRCVEGQKLDENNQYKKFWMSLYDEILNSISLELMVPEIFKEYQIEILSAWLSLIGKCSVENRSVELINLQNFINKELIVPQNIIMGNLSKLRVVMQNIVEKLNEKK